MWASNDPEDYTERAQLRFNCPLPNGSIRIRPNLHASNLLCAMTNAQCTSPSLRWATRCFALVVGSDEVYPDSPMAKNGLIILHTGCRQDSLTTTLLSPEENRCYHSELLRLSA